MTYKTILVHVDTDERCGTRVDIALRLARQFDAHLIGLHIRMPDAPPHREADAGRVAASLRHDEATNDARKAAALFQNRIRGTALVGAEWRETAGYAEDAIALHARYADLVIVGQSDPARHYPYPPDLPALLAFTTIRPVLAIPYAGDFHHLGENVLIAWNGSREATRAITNALPILKAATTVTVMAVNPVHGPLEHGEAPGDELAIYLARHGVEVNVSRQEKTEIDVGECLLSGAADFGVDLIVMGAYGHLRLREWILGGVTRTIARSMTVPVLMSH